MDRSRGLSHFLSAGVGLLVAACATGPAHLSPTSTAGRSATPASAIPSGTTLSATVLGSGTYPGVTVVAPPGWAAGDGHFVVDYASGGSLIGVSVWDVGQVPGDPCRWKTTLQTPENGVEGLVNALMAQEGRHATTPTSGTLAGWSGLYFEWSVPDWVVTGDADFAGCDDPGNGHHDFVSWFATDQAGERYEQVPGQVDRIWVLDVDGQRLVVDATYSPDTTSSDRAELATVVASLRFLSRP